MEAERIDRLFKGKPLFQMCSDYLYTVRVKPSVTQGELHRSSSTNNTSVLDWKFKHMHDN